MSGRLEVLVIDTASGTRHIIDRENGLVRREPGGGNPDAPRADLTNDGEVLELLSAVGEPEIGHRYSYWFRHPDHGRPILRSTTPVVSVREVP